MSRTEETNKQKKYAVLISFKDIEDGGALYWAGESTYPRDGYTPLGKRISELQSSKNGFKEPFISKETVN